MEYDQITHLWQHFITHKITTCEAALPLEVGDFFKASRVDFLDIEELDYLEYGQIFVRYFDLVHVEEEVEIRLVESLEGTFEPQWGFMGKDEKKHFDKWLSKRFALQEVHVQLLLSWMESFLRAVLKKQAE